MAIIYFTALFQFHMVRLKGRGFLCTLDRSNSISIPYGTIKSYAVQAWLELNAIFQFHMVRLKVPFLTMMFLFLSLFQFHMVRLKAVIIEPKELMYSFQFHMVRLKVMLFRPGWNSMPYFNSIWYD